MESMNKKAQELELRNIMQGLEEFATFMSFRGNTGGLRIISVESVDQPVLTEQPKRKAQVINMPKAFDNPSHHQSLNKSFSFQEQKYN